MSDIKLRTLKFEGLAGTYVLPEIPEATVANNGKVMKIVNGSWSTDDLFIVSDTAPSDTTKLWLKPV